MPVSLGPLPAHLRELIGRWIADQPPPAADDAPAIGGLLIASGPGVRCYLQPTGEVVRWDAWDNVVTTIDDGPEKVRLICNAIQHRSELADWLPPRPAYAHDCELCDKAGWLLPPLPRLVCSLCSGLGWLPVETG